MTIAKRPSPIQIETVQGDIRTTQWGRTWEQFKHLQKGFENTRGVKFQQWGKSTAV